MIKKKTITLESTLKSIETENWLDRKFYRPIGFMLALLLCKSGITPNMVTVFSFFVGIGGGICFYFNNLKINLLGVLLMISANILDCVDGQLARMAGIKSKIGRIIDGFAGDLWFTTIYVALAFRLVDLGWEYWIFIVAVISGYSHMRQAAMADYYKTLHLFFISKKKGEEFDSYENLQKHWKETRWKDDRIYKFFLFFYRFYTVGQEKITPKLQNLLQNLDSKYKGEIPEKIRIEFRKKSMTLMPLIDWLTFNGRTPVLFILVLAGSIFNGTLWAALPFAYYLYEILILNPVLILSVKKHEKICEQIQNELTISKV
jgi:hypothetical protein